MNRTANGDKVALTPATWIAAIGLGLAFLTALGGLCYTVYASSLDTRERLIRVEVSTDATKESVKAIAADVTETQGGVKAIATDVGEIREGLRDVERRVDRLEGAK